MHWYAYLFEKLLYFLNVELSKLNLKCVQLIKILLIARNNSFKSTFTLGTIRKTVLRREIFEQKSNVFVLFTNITLIQQVGINSFDSEHFVKHTVILQQWLKLQGRTSE